MSICPRGGLPVEQANFRTERNTLRITFHEYALTFPAVSLLNILSTCILKTMYNIIITVIVAIIMGIVHFERHDLFGSKRVTKKL